jgi:hypothetical protein
MPNSMPPSGPSESAQSQPDQNREKFPYGYNQPSDEIDLVELLGFFWKIRTEILIGLAAGLIIGGVIGQRFVKNSFKTEIPLSLERDEPSVADTKKFVETFNNNLNSTEISRQVWRSVLNQTPDLVRSFKDAGLSDEELAVQQTLSKKDGAAPLRLRESSSPRDFILEVNVPVQGLSPRVGDIFADALLFAMSEGSLMDSKSNPERAKPGVVKSKNQNASDEQDDRKDFFREQLLKSKQDYLKIEFLLNKIARSSPDFTAFMTSLDTEQRSLQFTIPPQGGTNGLSGAAIAEAQEYYILQAQFERMQRMVALLLAENRMKADEANDTIQRARGLRDQIFQLIPLARREAERAFGSIITGRARGKYVSRVSGNSEMISNVVAESVNMLLMPTLVSLNTEGTKPNVFEQPTSKRRIAIVLGAFLGAFAGFAFGGLRIFLQKNGKRLREVAAV